MSRKRGSVWPKNIQLKSSLMYKSTHLRCCHHFTFLIYAFLLFTKFLSFIVILHLRYVLSSKVLVLFFHTFSITYFQTCCAILALST